MKARRAAAEIEGQFGGRMRAESVLVRLPADDDVFVLVAEASATSDSSIADRHVRCREHVEVVRRQRRPPTLIRICAVVSIALVEVFGSRLSTQQVQIAPCLAWILPWRFTGEFLKRANGVLMLAMLFE